MSRMRLRWYGSAVLAIEKAARDRGLFMAAEHVLGEARRVVPIDEGTLERSGFTSVDDGRAAVSFDTPYAVVQHEDLSLAHAAGRKAKYLEEPLNQQKDTVQDIIANELDKALR